jgi:pimeloyl-ACP methyl ester carboxylesterase
MQAEIKITTLDHHKIYGTLNAPNDNVSKLIIFVHGLTGNREEHQYYNAVPFFTSRGFATFRFDMYGYHEGARRLVDSTIETHISDLEAVLAYFADKYDEIYLVGHSIGATVMCLCDHSSAKKLVLWDPTQGFDSVREKDIVWQAELGLYMLDWQMQILVSKEFIEQWRKITVSEEVANLKTPTKIIFAGKAEKYDKWKHSLSDIKVENEHVVIDGASHRFTEEGALVKLYNETLEFIN